MRKAPLTAKARQWLVNELHNKARLAIYHTDCEREDVLARDVLAHLYGDSWQDRFAAVPKGWLPMSDRVNIRLGDRYNGESWCLSLSDKVPLPAVLCQWEGLDADGALDDALLARLHAHTNTRVAEQDNLRKFHEELRTSLAAVRTLETLRASWPDAYDLLPEQFKGSTYPLPAGTIEETLRLYGLLVSDFAPPRQDVAPQVVD